jgi:ribosome maturation protein Sdo1
LQYNEIYSNVSKGDVTSSKDLAKYFPNKEKDEIVR